jgi:hypothetical protein
VFDWGGQEYKVSYLPAESDTGMVRRELQLARPRLVSPMNLVILRGLGQLHRYYGDRLKVECPTAPGAR